MITTNKQNKHYEEKDYQEGNVIKKGENYRSYSYCVQVFEADVGKVMIQSNNNDIIKGVAKTLEEHDVKCELNWAYMMQVNHVMDDKLIEIVEDAVDDLIHQISGYDETIYKFSKKSGDPMNKKLDCHKPAIIVW